MPEHLDRLTDSLARDTLAAGVPRAGRGALVALTAARPSATLIEPGDSEAFHFCGHTYTTGSCPHPTGLPRIDSRGFPLRASDGQPIDDIGRPVNGEGQPVDDHGKLLRDAEAGRCRPRRGRSSARGRDIYGFRRTSTAPGTDAAAARSASSATAARTGTPGSTATRH